MPHEKEDHAMFELVTSNQSSTGKALRITKPSDILPVHDRKELMLQLEHYSRPFLKHLVPNSAFARRFYILYTRPALRYYCHKFGVKIPKWLQTDEYYENLPDDEKQDMFGTTKLRWNGEFKPLPRATTMGHVQR